MRNETLVKLISHLHNVIKDNVSMNAYAEKTGLPQNYFCNKRKQLEFDYEANKVSNEQYSTVMDLFKQIKERGYVGTTKSKAKKTS